GIGKPTLVNIFLHRAQQTGQLWIARGQCLEHYGVGAPYLPLLDALGRLCQQPGAEPLVRVFEQHAPVWLAQLSTLLSQEQRKAPSLNLAGAPPEPTLRGRAAGVVGGAPEPPHIALLGGLA